MTDEGPIMQRGQTPPQAGERVLAVHQPGPDGLRPDASQRLGAMASPEARPQAGEAAATAAANDDAGATARAGELGAGAGALSFVPCVGDTLTITGVFEPETRWLPRLKCWLLRRPPPMSDKLVQFRVSQIVGAGVKTLHAGQSR